MSDELPFKIIRVSDAKQHHCYRPTHRSRDGLMGVGAIIECRECGVRWVCSKVNHGDQRDPISPPLLEWVRYLK